MYLTVCVTMFFFCLAQTLVGSNIWSLHLKCLKEKKEKDVAAVNVIAICNLKTELWA